MKTNIIVTMIILAWASTAGAGSMDEWFVKQDDPDRWKVPAADEQVAGNQNTWYVTPHDLQLGSFGHAANKDKVLKVSESEIQYIPQSVWGQYTWKLTPDGDEAAFAEWSKNFSTEKNFRFGGIVTEIGPNRKVFQAKIEAKRGEGPSLPVKMELLKIEREKPLPDFHSVQYGPHWRHAYDVYLPDGFDPKKDEPLPVVMNIHGGGWGALDKQTSGERWNKNGIAVISINYRYTGEFEQPPAMTVPVAAPLIDAARALQHVKYHAKDYGINPDKILLTGGSAGGATSAWLALHDDMADPDSDDPVARVSTRVYCSTPNQAQTSLDPRQMREWIPEITYGTQCFITDYPDELGRDKEKKFEYWLEHREEVLPAIKEFSAYEWASADDPPMMLVYGGQKDIPVSEGGNATHHPKFGEHLHKRLKELGVESYYWADNVSSGVPRYDGWAGVALFTLDKLKGPGWEEELEKNKEENQKKD